MGGLILFYPYGNKSATAVLHDNPWKRPWRRSLQHRAVLDRKVSEVAGTHQLLVVRRVVHGTGKVRALLTVSDNTVLRGSHQNAVVPFRRIGKQLHSAHRHGIQHADNLLGLRTATTKPRANQNPKISYEHAQAGQNQEFGELPPGDITFVGSKDRKLFLPERFPAGAAESLHSTASHM
jgi:hypothetical protein